MKPHLLIPLLVVCVGVPLVVLGMYYLCESLPGIEAARAREKDGIASIQAERAAARAAREKAESEATEWETAEERTAARRHATAERQSNGEAQEDDNDLASVRHRAEQGDEKAQGFLKLWEQFSNDAKQGNSLAQVALGKIYLNGTQVEKDPRKAVKWFRKAAKQGNPIGQHELGKCYLRGEGVEQDIARGSALVRKAADQELTPAQTLCGSLSLMLSSNESERGKKEELRELGIKWLQKAANQGEEAAIEALKVKEQGTEAMREVLGRYDY